MDELRYIIDHLFFPLELPQKDDRLPGREHALVDIVSTSSLAYRGRCLAEDCPSSDAWPALVDLLAGMAHLYSADPDYSAEDVALRLANMDTGGTCLSAF